eukprot:6471095-Amphidinium_carterae.1
MKMSKKAEQLKKAREVKKERHQNLLALDDAAPSGKAGMAVPKRAKTLIDLAPTALREVLCNLSPVIFSKNNTLTIMKESNCQEKLLQFVEFLTGVIPRSFDLTSDMQTLAQVAAKLKPMQSVRNNRLMEISLSPAWETIGVYRIQELTPTGEASIINRYTGQILSIKCGFPLNA